MVTANEIRAVEEGFQSPEGARILQSLCTLADLLEEANAAEASRVRRLAARLRGQSRASREAVIAAITGELSEEFLLAQLASLRSRVPAAPSPSASPPKGAAKHVVLNCANIGCTYGQEVERRQRGNRFSWAGVEDACRFYLERGYVVHAVANQRLLQRAGRDVSQRLSAALVVVPSRDEMPDLDDLATIIEAYKWRCPFVDNDNYRNWSPRISTEEVAKWYRENKAKLHISYYFSGASFTPFQGEPPRQASAEGNEGSQASRPSTAPQPRSLRPPWRIPRPAAPASLPSALGKRPEASEPSMATHKRRRDEASAPAKQAPAASGSAASAASAPSAPPSAPPKWKVLKLTPLWPRKHDDDASLRPLRTLKPGEQFRAISQLPAEGYPLWLAIAPRGWIKVAPLAEPNVVPA
ncbi:unnamed protein product [Effrenium voratum]|nr:unnamed protein product [Effrenium voratum]